MDTKNKTLGKWYKSLEVKHELIIDNGRLVFPLVDLPKEEDIIAVLRVVHGYRAKVVTTSVETRPYELIDESDRDEYYGFHHELRDSPEHIFHTDALYAEVRKRVKENAE
ncbi:hypothetical protein MG295_00158 [Bacillus phage vB_BcgM]|nr:hypothetical protein MG295_00158 [Bacillus phage vB_BcgM]